MKAARRLGALKARMDARARFWQHWHWLRHVPVAWLSMSPLFWLWRMQRGAVYAH
jgi:hypothetical protein